jgi:hypothetical protein
VMEPVFEPVKGGPTTSDLLPDGTFRGLAPAEFVTRHATPKEWEQFRKIVAARVAKEPKEVLIRCGACGFVSSRPFHRRSGEACIKCNWAEYVDGGTMRDMTPAEVKAHLEAEAKRDAAWRERMERADFAHRNDDRRKHGLVSLTLDEFRAERKAEAEARAKERRELMNLARRLTKDLPR